MILLNLIVGIFYFFSKESNGETMHIYAECSLFAHIYKGHQQI